MAKVTGLKVNVQAQTTNTLYATWSFSKSHLDHYNVKWYYVVNGVTFLANSTTTTSKNSTYNPPENAVSAKISVAPVSTKHKVKKKNKSYWSSQYVTVNYSLSRTPPEQPSAPTVTLDKYKLEARVETMDSKADQFEFQVLKDNTSFATGIVTTQNGLAVYSCNIDAGSKYRIRCRAINLVGTSKVYSEWSAYSSESETIPNAITGVTVTVENKTSVRISWTGTSNAESYEVEYANNRNYFDSSSEVSSSTSETTYAIVNGLDTGYEWFFRVRAVNNQGQSGWSEIVSVILGSTPIAPTTWSSTTTAMVGETVTLYWVHNTEDGSTQVSAEIELDVDGVKKTITVDNDRDEDEKDKTSSYILDLSEYSDGARILWRVRTKGITGEFGDWSIQRTINLYAPATLQLTISSDILESFPYTITAKAGPINQTPMSYHISITADDTYETEDDIGNITQVSAGEEVYSEHFNIFSDPFRLELSAGDITLCNNQSYTIIATVVMDSGLTAESQAGFTVSWSDTAYEPDAAIAIDEDLLCAYITPFCEDDEEALIPNVTLSVYRRDFDGRFTEIARDLENDKTVTVTDPHPALDYARYRIVARDTNTGSISYEDIPGEPVDEPALVMQWDETWSRFDYSPELEDELEEPLWAGSMVKLPYNIEISESYTQDVTMINYIGRTNPVAYYGTQIDSNGNWTTEIDKNDKETIYALRRLAIWPGDVYVREPTGTGYWAQVTVSMNTSYSKLTLPITFTVKRVEGSRI